MTVESNDTQLVSHRHLVLHDQSWFLAQTIHYRACHITMCEYLPTYTIVHGADEVIGDGDLNSRSSRIERHKSEISDDITPLVHTWSVKYRITRSENLALYEIGLNSLTGEAYDPWNTIDIPECTKIPSYVTPTQQGGIWRKTMWQCVNKNETGDRRQETGELERRKKTC